MDEVKKERRVYTFFEIAVYVKGVLAFLEVVMGLLALLVSPAFVLQITTVLTRPELGEDPSDFVANYLLRLAHTYSIGTHVFAALYLLVHGVLKLGLVVALLAGRLWAYPASLIIFALLAAYQAYLYSTNDSTALAIITVLDCVVLWLIAREYEIVRAHLASRAV